MKKSNISAWLLILIGVILLFNQLDYIKFSRGNFLIMACFFLGAVLLNKGFNNSERKGILGGSFFILEGSALLLMHMGYLPTIDSIGWGVFFINIGLANMVYYLFKRTHFSNLATGLIFILIGVPFVAAAYDLIRIWMIADVLSVYWPVILILIGAGLLIEGMVKRVH
ncbi:MAG: hypothetical protein AB7T22_07765 [Calditrichaceae bacterium]